MSFFIPPQRELLLCSKLICMNCEHFFTAYHSLAAVEFSCPRCGQREGAGRFAHGARSK